MTTFSKAEYLQRYLSSDKEDAEKRKKKKKARKTTGLRIVEDDAFIAVAAQFKNVDSDEEKEDIEIISSITKQVEEKAREAPRFRNSFQPLDEVKCEPSSPSAEESKIGLGSVNFECSDSAGPRSSRRRHDSDSDQSLQRHCGAGRKTRKRHDSDQSPPRKIDRGAKLSPGRYDRCHNEGDGAIKTEVDSDLSPPRREQFKRNRESDSDQSLPRRQSKKSPHGSRRQVHHHSGRSKRRRESESDQSPMRRPERSKRRESDSDQSPPRSRGKESSQTFKSRARHDRDDSHSRSRVKETARSRRVASPELLSKETKRTLDGKIAGLQSADDLKKESEELRQQEAKIFEELDSSVSGRYAMTTLRQKQVRKGKDKPEDKERKEREAKKQAELQEKYDLWNKGVAQAEKRGQQMEEMARVAAEPLARMADDEEMNKHLKSIIHEEDPMAAILESKKREDAIDRGELVYPTYQGECPPNRFGIRPGYRWDGVDRSNGFEAKLARAKNVRSAEDREYYQNIQVYE